MILINGIEIVLLVNGPNIVQLGKLVLTIIYYGWNVSLNSVTAVQAFY